MGCAFSVSFNLIHLFLMAGFCHANIQEMNTDSIVTAVCRENTIVFSFGKCRTHLCRLIGKERQIRRSGK